MCHSVKSRGGVKIQPNRSSLPASRSTSSKARRWWSEPRNFRQISRNPSKRKIWAWRHCGNSAKLCSAIWCAFECKVLGWQLFDSRIRDQNWWLLALNQRDHFRYYLILVNLQIAWLKVEKEFLKSYKNQLSWQWAPQSPNNLVLLEWPQGTINYHFLDNHGPIVYG